MSTKYDIKTLGDINVYGLMSLESHFTINKVEENQADAWVVRSQKFHETQFPESLLAIARSGAGFNNIPIERCASEGIVVFNTPGANANAVKELVLGAMITSARHYREADVWTNHLTGSDEEIAEQVEEGKKQFSGSEIFGKTLGVIGLGNIGSRVANDAQRLGMRVLGYDPYLSVEHAWDLSHHVHRVNTTDEIFKEADYITVHTPLTEETRGIYSKINLGKMKNGVVLINFAREKIAVNADVAAAVKTGKVKNFVTDFGSELFVNNPNILVSPHIGGSTAESELNCVRVCAENLRLFLETGQITNSVNFPRVHQSLTTAYRITLINKNVPNVVADITKAVSEDAINIANIVNRAQGDFAYTLLDLDENDERKIKALVERFETSDKIVRVRLIRNSKK